MLLLAAAIAASATPPYRPAGPTVQATATVRILAGTRIHFGRHGGRDEGLVRDTVLRTDGATQPARLVEFQ